MKTIESVTLKMTGEVLPTKAVEWLAKRYSVKEWESELYRLLMQPDFVLEKRINQLKNMK